MAILKKRPKGKRVIDLTGPDGNAMVLLALARDFCRQLSIDWTPIRTEMIESDYENLIKVFDRHFGDYVDLVR